LLIPRETRVRRPLIVGAALLSVAVGISRPMLGVHWPSDVVAGWAFGLFWILLLFRLAGRSFDSGLRLRSVPTQDERQG
jgi:undecaprenyl-diphosphatase